MPKADSAIPCPSCNLDSRGKSIMPLNMALVQHTWSEVCKQCEDWKWLFRCSMCAEEAPETSGYGVKRFFDPRGKSKNKMQPRCIGHMQEAKQQSYLRREQKKIAMKEKELKQLKLAVA